MISYRFTYRDDAGNTHEDSRGGAEPAHLPRRGDWIPSADGAADLNVICWRWSSDRKSVEICCVRYEREKGEQKP